MLTLDEAINHCHEKAKELRAEAEELQGKKDYIESNERNPKGIYDKPLADCLECAKEHEQLVDWLTELQERREEDRWIPVSEMLPEKEGRCLVFTDYGDVTMDSFVDGMFVCNLGNVTHWRPLPHKPYESETENESETLHL